MKLKITIVIIFCVSMFAALSQENDVKEYNLSVKLKKNLFNFNHDKKIVADSLVCIKDSADAVKIAKIEFIKVYGEEVLQQEPFIAVLKDSIWCIHGTFPYSQLDSISSHDIKSLPDSIDVNGNEYYFQYVQVGGVAWIKINKNTCEIIEINHGE